MERKKIDDNHLVFNAILENFSTAEVERNLSPAALLVDDLGLDSADIYYLGLVIERDLQRLGLGALSDAEIMSWKEVKDIVNTVSIRTKNTER